ncbi:hypothetical protein [Colwellia psychrerythraea]|uniref:Uncharacterized protein n=1 Tax=Colwellia psychrerythraea TaxID=28229 RepID=A0A099KCL6_COLPS|nr:hypothetical protein [Colwellia psychrerythraea]KGJ87777.1 hypothetical protein GAB14E_4455 [Colwellia psychrerythraea]
MSFFAYLYQVKASFRRFFYSSTSVTPEQETTQYAQEVNDEIKHNLKIKCRRAAQEIQYLRCFSHWPIARAKIKIEKNSLVYLDISRSKRSNFEHIDQHRDKVIALNKTVRPNKIVKKIP